METRQFATAAKVFSELEKKASIEKKFQPNGRTAFGIAKNFMNSYAVIRAGKRIIYKEGTYDALACVCEAAKELGDYGY